MKKKYLGRIVTIAKNNEGMPIAVYRVSSRSFPNRKAVIQKNNKQVSIIPIEGHEKDIQKNPYIAYNCLKIVKNYAIITNGSQTDPIAEKIEQGMLIRDALAITLIAMDYEKDDYDTPRICAVIDCKSQNAWLAVVRKNGIDIREIVLKNNQIMHLATYEDNIIDEKNISKFQAENAQEAAQFVIDKGIFKNFTNPVTAVAVMWDKKKYQIAIKDINN